MVALCGMLLIATTYGMARFGVGLSAPRLVDERPVLRHVVGLAGAAQFVSYALAAAVAARIADVRPRVTLVLAGATAALGSAGVANASGPSALVLAVFVAGMGAGFASPVLVGVVDDAVAERHASTAQSLVNAGTAVGVVAAGTLAFVVSRIAPMWVTIAAACGASALAVLLLVGGPSTRPPGGVDDARPGPGRAAWRELAAPAVAAFVVGAGSALIWTFGPLLVTSSGAVDPRNVGVLWIALGVGGLLGPAAGPVADRWGPARAWGLFVGLAVLANLVLAVGLGAGRAWVSFGAMALFGAGYMCLSGVLILWARRVWPSAPGAGTSILFIALALGQAVASAGFEELLLRASPSATILTAAALCAVGAVTTTRGANRQD